MTSREFQTRPGFLLDETSLRPTDLGTFGVNVYANIHALCSEGADASHVLASFSHGGFSLDLRLSPAEANAIAAALYKSAATCKAFDTQYAAGGKA